jgi:putative SOS response-associated peptidase YedK
VLPATWGIVKNGSKDASMAAGTINARAETVEKRGAFRDAFYERRCVVPADGFFEWTGPKTARQPTWFHREDRQLILFAGLYEVRQKEQGAWETTFTILTTAANALLESYHDRMPAILADRDADNWMDPRAPDPVALKRLLVPAPGDLLIATPVSPDVNDVDNDSPDLLRPAGQMSLSLRSG